jgi:teichuronic acid biosynthesis glycosyltransferase TuaC
MKTNNLLIIAPDYPDENNKMIGSLFVKEQVSYLKNHFNEIYVIAPVLNAFNMTDQSKYCKNYKYDNVSVYFPRCWFYPRAIKLFPISNYTKLLFDNRCSVIFKTIKQYNLQFDLIHSHMTFPATYTACKLKEKYEVPVVATIHEDSGWLREEMDMNHPKLNYAWENADTLIRVNSSEIPLLQKYNRNVKFVPNGFTETYRPFDKIACRDLLHLDKTQKIIFTYGSFDERKGFQTLIEAMSYLKDSGIKCYISGAGSYKTNLEKLVNDYNIGDTVKILDFMSDAELCHWVNASDLFIFPSLRESFGITQINALACGTPVIASTNVGSKEIICSKSGLLYNVGDASDLFRKIILGLYTRFWDRKYIRNYVEHNYSWKEISNQLVILYKDLIECRKK